MSNCVMCEKQTIYGLHFGNGNLLCLSCVARVKEAHVKVVYPTLQEEKKTGLLCEYCSKEAEWSVSCKVCSKHSNQRGIMSTRWACESHIGMARASVRKEEIKCEKEGD